ncbi:hypothetical protein ACSSS7_001616 [Eimeria intestinalis]
MSRREEPAPHTSGARIPASDLPSLVEFIASRVAAAHRCTCCVPRQAATKTPAVDARVGTICSCNKTLYGAEGQHPWRVLVAIGGIAGSGKSTLAARLQAALNAKASMWICECLSKSTRSRDARAEKAHDGLLTLKGPEFVTAIGIDGFHLTRAQLDRCPRGPQTPRGAVDIQHAGFLDPEENGHIVAAKTRVVLVEGLYTLLPEGEYFSTPRVFDLRIFIDTPKPVAAARVIKRHVTSGICRNEEEAELRWLENDSLNADYILGKLRLEDINLIIEGDK